MRWMHHLLENLLENIHEKSWNNFLACTDGHSGGYTVYSTEDLTKSTPNKTSLFQ